MQQYIYGNIGHSGYRYVSSEPEFFADGQRTAVLRHLVNYDVFCIHGDLAADAHQSYWMAVSNLDNPAAPDRLYLQASGGDSYRTGYYAQGYISDAEDGYLFDSRLLGLLRTRFSEFGQTMAAAEAGNLRRLDCEDLPQQAELQPATLDPELLRNVLLTLLQKKKVIIRLPAAGAQAMRMSREYILAIYERLPYEQRAVNGFVTGISAAKLRDQVALPAVVKIMLMDADAEFDGVKTNAYQTVFDLADPNFRISPMPRVNREGKPLSHVPLIDFLAEQSPAVLDEFFAFCRSCMRKDVNGNNLSILDYSMYLDFFAIGRGECTDNSIRSWAANVFGNANSNSKWTPEIKKLLYSRIASALTPERLKQYLLSGIHSFTDLTVLGVLDEEERSQLHGKKGSDITVRDVHAALTLKMTELLMAYYPAGTQQMLLDALGERFLELACEDYPFLLEDQPTRATVAQLNALALPEATGKTTELVVSLRERVYENLYRLRDLKMQHYREQYEVQRVAGLQRIGRWPGALAETVEALFADLQTHYLFAELIADADSRWNETIGGQLAEFCVRSVPHGLEEYSRLLAFAAESLERIPAYGGQLYPEHGAAVTAVMDAWRYVLTVHQPGRNPADDFSARMAGLEKLEILLANYPQEARKTLAESVAANQIALAKLAYPCLTEEKPTAETVTALQALAFPVTGAAVGNAQTLRNGIYERLSRKRDAVLRTYQEQYSTQHRLGLDHIGQWCAQRYDTIDSLLNDLRQHYLFDELMAYEGEGNWRGSIGTRLAKLCREAEPRELQHYTNFCTWTNRNIAALEQAGILLDAPSLETVAEALKLWNRVLELSQRSCGNLAEVLTFLKDVRETPMDGTLAAELMLAGTALLKQKGLSRTEIFGNIERLLQEARQVSTGELLAQMVNACEELHHIAGQATAEQIASYLGIYKLLEDAGLKTAGVRVDVWATQGTAAELQKALQDLTGWRSGAYEPDFINRTFRNWAADNLQSNTDLMYLLALRYPQYREKLIPVLAGQSGAVTREQLKALYVSGCRKSLLCQGAGEKTCASWKSHILALFPEWTELPEPSGRVLRAENGKYKTSLILLSLVLALTGLLPGAAMLATGLFSMGICALWLGAMIAILAICEIAGFSVRNLVQRRFACRLGLGAIPGIILTIVVMVIQLV